MRRRDRVRFVVFDNGNLRRRADGQWDWDAEPYSRVAGFEIDEQQMRAAPTFSLGSDDPEDPDWFYSEGRGDADVLPGGDRLQYVVGWDDLPYIAEVSYPGGDELWRAEMVAGSDVYRVNYFPSLYDTTWSYAAADRGSVLLSDRVPRLRHRR